jgi:hypothetical protein
MSMRSILFRRWLRKVGAVSLLLGLAAVARAIPFSPESLEKFGLGATSWAGSAPGSFLYSPLDETLGPTWELSEEIPLFSFPAAMPAPSENPSTDFLDSLTVDPISGNSPLFAPESNPPLLNETTSSFTVPDNSGAGFLMAGGISLLFFVQSKLRGGGRR